MDDQAQQDSSQSHLEPPTEDWENVGILMEKALENPLESGESQAKLDSAALDSLLDLDKKNNSKERIPSSINALINSDLIYYERLPMLEVVFDRLVRMLSTSLRKLTSDNVGVSFDGISTVRFGDYLNSVSLPTLLSVFRAEQWGNQGVLVIDSSVIYSVIDVLLGGRRGAGLSKVDDRVYTTIERNLIERMVKVILWDLRLAFEPVSDVTFKLERLETNPRFAMIARAANAAILVKMRIEMEDRGGKIEIILPYATIEPIREVLLQNFMGEKFGRDSIWEHHLIQQLWNTDVTLEVALEPKAAGLQDVLQWAVGTQILLQSSPDSLVSISSGGEPLFAGKVGQRSGKVAIKIEEILFGQTRREV